MNASVSPWNHTFDLHYGLKIPVVGREIELSFDILNLVNLFDEDSGHVRYASFNAVSPVEWHGYDDQDNPLSSPSRIHPLTRCLGSSPGMSHPTSS